jgi:anti-anti-sigma factor
MTGGALVGFFDARVSPGMVALSGEIDMDVTGQLREALLAAAEQSSAPVVVDMSEVTFIDSSGLNELVQLSNRGAGVRIISPTDSVRRTIEVVGLEHLLAYG